MILSFKRAKMTNKAAAARAAYSWIILSLVLRESSCLITPGRNVQRTFNCRDNPVVSMGQLITEGSEDNEERDYMGLLRSESSEKSINPFQGDKWGYRDTSWSPGSETSWSSNTQEVSLGDADSDPDDVTAQVKAAVEQAKVMESEEEQMVPVRFVNFDTENPLKQKVVFASQGKNILKVGDEAGIVIPRQCRSGLCGSCTADIKDPLWDEGSRPGYQTVRTCQAGAMVPAGCEEMIVDLYRLIANDKTDTNEERGRVTAGGPGARAAATRVSTGGPNMKNFEDGWEAGFVPDYKSGGQSESQQRSAAATSAATNQKSAQPATTQTTSTPTKKLRRWFPRSSDNIAPWDIVG